MQMKPLQQPTCCLGFKPNIATSLLLYHQWWNHYQSWL